MSPFKSLADKIKGGKMGDDLSKTAKGMNDTGNAASGSSQKLLSSAKAFVLIAVGVLAIAVAFAILANSAISLAQARTACNRSYGRYGCCGCRAWRRHDATLKIA